MTIGDIIKQYRTDHGLSLRDFAKISGVSNAYLSMLEKNEHPKTKKPIAPSMDKMKCVASAMGISLDTLLREIDGDQPVFLGGKEKGAKIDLSNEESVFLSKYRMLNIEGKKRLSERADELLDLGYVQKGEEQKMG